MIKSYSEPHIFNPADIECGTETTVRCIVCGHECTKEFSHEMETVYIFSRIDDEGYSKHFKIKKCKWCGKGEERSNGVYSNPTVSEENCNIETIREGVCVRQNPEKGIFEQGFAAGPYYHVGEYCECTKCGYNQYYPYLDDDGNARDPWEEGDTDYLGSPFNGTPGNQDPGGDNPGGQTPNGTLPGYTPSSPIITPEQECEHDDTKVKHDDDLHWEVCTKCNNIIQNSEDPHTFGEVTDDGGTTGTHSAVCTFEGCGYKQTQAHEFDDSGNCTECDAIQNTGCQHDYSIVSNDDTHHWTGCSKCGEIQEESKKEHNLGKYENNQDGTHIAKCTFTGCEYKSALMHTFDENGKCEECDAESCDEGEHEFSIFKWNDTQHWLACKWCEGAKKDSIENHKFEQWTMNANGKQQSECTNKDCGYIAEKDAENPGGNDADGILGDVNLNGEIDITDITTLNEHVLAELSESMPEWILKDKALTLADLNKDGNVDISDITELNTIVLNSIINGN